MTEPTPNVLTPSVPRLEPVRLVEAGAYADASASLLMLRATIEEESLELCKADVYCQNGIWVDLKARRVRPGPVKVSSPSPVTLAA